MNEHFVPDASLFTSITDIDLTFNHVAVVVGFVLAIVLFARIFRHHATPTTSIAWLLAIVFMPYVGVPAYLIFGGRKLRRRADAKHRLRYPLMGPVAKPPTDHVAPRVLAAFDMPPARPGTKVELITDGGIAFTQILNLIDEANSSIELQTFIFTDDSTGRVIAEHLQARAQAGVEVLVLVDALGSFLARFRLLRQLSRGGVKVGVFMRMMPVRRRWSANLRNHRKLAVFDKHTALVGGMNIGVSYMGSEADPSRWLDTCMVLQGPIVADIQSVFANDWEFATRESRDVATPVAEPLHPGEVVQLLVSGPDVDGEPLSDIVVSSIHKARERVWLISPYFVPDAGIIRALNTQARLGVDVRIVLPRRSNHWTADMARNRILRELGMSGVKLYLHPDKMIHAKHMIIDDDLLLSGSANLDLRSLYYNYEMALLHYSPATILAVATWAGGVIAECEEPDLSEPGFFKRWAEDLCWLVGPLL
jgi:cardiolipin synthase